MHLLKTLVIPFVSLKIRTLPGLWHDYEVGAIREEFTLGYVLRKYVNWHRLDGIGNMARILPRVISFTEFPQLVYVSYVNTR